MQGFNMGRYVPPDLEGIASFNQASGKRILTPTVRFELPYSIWCTSCPKPTIIGQGVRFNAEKKKVGNYFSTPIFSFRFKHTACGKWIEIRTDPKNTAYVVTEGAKKRDTGEDRLKEGEVIIGGGKTEEEKKRLEGDPFAKLEEGNEDKAVAKTEKKRIEQLYERNDRDWEDPGTANAKLRRAFRVDRKVRHKRAQATEDLQDRMGIGIDLLEETDDDGRRARLIEFGDAGGDGALVKARTKGLFATDKQERSESKAAKRLKRADVAKAQKEALRKDLSNNTRAVMDPFLDNTNGPRKANSGLPLRKRKHESSPANGEQSTLPGTKVSTTVPQPEDTKPKATLTNPMSAIPLVDYDTD